MNRIFRLFLAALLCCLILVNLLAFMQARAMTRFVESGGRTGRPEQLSVVERIGLLLSGMRIPRPINRRTPAALGLPYEPHRIPSAGGAVLDAWFIPGAGDRPIVALFHGYAATKSTLLEIAREFHRLGHPALLVDFYGSGDSSGSGTTVGVKEADDVGAVVEYSRRTWPQRRLVLYGFSMGGAAVLRALAINGVRAAGAIIEASFDSLLNTARNRFGAMGLPASPFTELLLFWGGVQNGFNPFAHNPVDYARVIRIPVLILHGGADLRVPPGQARSVAAALKGNARLVVYEGVPHIPVVVAKRDEWRRDVASFLESIRRGPRP